MNDDIDLTLFFKIQELMEYWQIEDQLRPSLGSRENFKTERSERIYKPSTSAKNATKATKRKIIELRKTKTIREIAKITGFSATSIYAVCGSIDKKANDIERNKLIIEMRNSGMTLSQISNEFGLNRSRILRICNQCQSQPN